MKILDTFNTKRKFSILNGKGDIVFGAAELTSFLGSCCGPARPFEIAFVNKEGQEVIRATRPLRCDWCMFPCCLQEITVCSPPGEVIGKVKQVCHPLRSKYAILDNTGNTVLYVSGGIGQCCCSFNFQVLALDGEQEVGRVKKNFTGLPSEALNDTNILGVSFPLDLDTRIKATLLTIAFLVKILHYQE